MKLRKRLNFIDRIRESTTRNGAKGAIIMLYAVQFLVFPQSSDGNPFCFIPGLCKTAIEEKKPDPPRYREMPLVTYGHGPGKNKDCICESIVHYPPEFKGLIQGSTNATIYPSGIPCEGVSYAKDTGYPNAYYVGFYAFGNYHRWWIDNVTYTWECRNEKGPRHYAEPLPYNYPLSIEVRPN